ncbi:DUF5313 family protein [Sciscionella marina]|uniref:DUF5313 family protein n=1 Tax=Sciscionella marina TaxID=508770 RepID=UPI00036EFE2B|nr:DUF5313 family protein [Sciscionella marina]
MTMARPNPAQWIWHAIGGRLPMRYKEWALHDATCRTWWLRYLAGVLLRVSVPALILFFVLASFGGPLWLAFLSVLLGLIVSIYYGLTYAPDSIDSRLVRYGYPPRTASTVREQANEEKVRAERLDYDSVWRSET